MPANVLLVNMGAEVARLSEWIDRHNAHKSQEAVTWGRLAKLAEETGEIIQEMILHTGQNPRKPQDDRTAELIKENLDVALTAFGNVEHLTGNQGESLLRFLTHLGNVVTRAEQAGMISPITVQAD